MESKQIHKATCCTILLYILEKAKLYVRKQVSRMGQGPHYRRAKENWRDGGNILFLNCFVGYLATHLSNCRTCVENRFFFIYKLYFDFFFQMQKGTNKSRYVSYLLKDISKPDQCIFWGLENSRPNHKNKRRLSHGRNFRTKNHRLISSLLFFSSLAKLDIMI